MSKVHVGTMGWSYDFWKDNFYPKDTNAKEFLAEYSKHFDTVEVDNTFYRIPGEDTVKKWKEQTPRHFLFSAKFPKVITHEKMLKNCEKETTFFIERISHLQDKLGPLLIQFPPRFKLGHLTLLDDFLSILPKGYRFAVEVRNREFLQDKFYSLLRKNGIALAMVDSPSMPRTDEATADFVYIRWEGDRKKVNGTLGKVEVDRTNDVKVWAHEIDKLLDTTPEVFGYFSKYFSGHPPTDAMQLLSFL
jgi:uncharacterized protein YecE (DUF72 family)